jgi:glycosyltransferase involved in cell wall biosynthesis
MIRICHLGKYYPPAYGGMETHVEALARGQQRLGADVTVMCVNHQSKAGDDLRDRRFGVSPTVQSVENGVSVVRFGRCAGFSKLDVCPEIAGLSSHLRGFDVIHLPAPNPTFSIPLLLTRQSAPLFVTHQSDVIKQRLLAKVFHPIERRIYTRAQRILASSPWYLTGSPLLRRFQYKVEVLPLGIDVSSYSEPSSAVQAKAEEFRKRFGSPMWLSVGRLVYYKGLHTAVEALSKVAGCLVVVGRGHLESTLKQLAESFGVADRIHWFPNASPDDLRALYLAATALWFPSNHRSEAFGLVQVEAMAAGCPVINTNVPSSGVSWVAPHEVAALTVAPESPDQLAFASQRLASDELLRRKLILNGKRRAVRMFDERRMAQASLAIYEGRSSQPEALFGSPEVRPRTNRFPATTSVLQQLEDAAV